MGYVCKVDSTEELANVLAEISATPTDDDVDACLEYVYDAFAELFYESIQDFVDKNWDRWEGEDE